MQSQAVPSHEAIFAAVAHLSSGVYHQCAQPQGSAVFPGLRSPIRALRRSSKMLAFIFLGALFDVNSMLWCAVLAWFSARPVTGYGRVRAGILLVESYCRRHVRAAGYPSGTG